MKPAVLVLCAVALMGASTVPPQSQRTAMYYVGHPAELRAVLAACRNNPGAAKHNPDCENVTQAEIILEADRASAMTDMTPPSNPHYWFVHPEQLAPEMFYCEHAQSAETRRAIFCDSAEAAEKMR